MEPLLRMPSLRLFASAETAPRLDYSADPVCANARRRLINNDLLIDLSPDIMSASQMHGCPLNDVRYCLQTHPHADHLDLSHLLSRSPAFGVVGAPVLEFYASRETAMRAAETFARDLAGYGLLAPEAEKHLNFRIHQVQPLEFFTVGQY